jgi:hypothetical protein
MTIPHPPDGLTSSGRARTVRTSLSSPAAKVLGTLLLLVALGVATGQVVGHLLAVGVESLLDVIDLDRAG